MSFFDIINKWFDTSLIDEEQWKELEYDIQMEEERISDAAFDCGFQVGLETNY